MDINLEIIALSAAVSVLCACGNAGSYDLADHVGCCTSFDNAALVDAAGGNYIEIGIAGCLCPESSEETFSQTVTEASGCSLPLYSGNGYYPGNIKLVGPDANLERAVEYSRVAVARAESLGLKIMVLGSGAARKIPDGFDREEAHRQFVSLLKEIGPIAVEHGITVVIEPLCEAETNFINSVREGTAICREVDHPGIRVLADFYHMAKSGEDAGAIVEAGPLLRHCHIAELEGRTAPGVHGDDFTPYFKALKEIGYDGAISIECCWDDFDSQIATAISTVREQIHSIN